MEFWEKNHILIDKSVDQLSSRFSVLEDDLFNMIRDYLFTFNMVNGAFDPNQDPSQIINSIRSEVESMLRHVNLDEGIEQFVLNFDEIESNVQSLHLARNGVQLSAPALNGHKAFAIESATFAMREANVNMSFVDPIKRLLYSRVTLGTDVLESERALRAFVHGLPGKKGVLNRWAGQVARDSISQFEGTLHQAVKTEFDLTAQEYVGSLVRDSRAQCKRWVAMGRIEDAILAAEIAWAFRNGSGMIPGTGPGNFSVYTGGYNCNHTSFPVR